MNEEFDNRQKVNDEPITIESDLTDEEIESSYHDRSEEMDDLTTDPNEPYTRMDNDDDSDIFTEDQTDEPYGVYDKEDDLNLPTDPEQKKAGSRNFLQFLSPILFILVLLINYLSATGRTFPNTQAEINDQYTNLLSPAGFSFSIWSVIYLGVALTLAVRYIKGNDQRFLKEYKKLEPFNWAWMILNIGWIITFTYDQLAVSTFLIVLYAMALGYLSFKVTSTPALHDALLLLKWPIGLHFGWLIVAAFPNLTTVFVKYGLDGVGMAGVAWTVVAMILIILASLYFFRTHENIAIFLPALWALIGILVKQSPNSDFPFASTTVFILSIILLIGGVGLAAISIFQRYQERGHNKA